MSGDVPTPQVRHGLSVRYLGCKVGTPHVIRYINGHGPLHVTQSSTVAGNPFRTKKGGGWEEKLLRPQPTRA